MPTQTLRTRYGSTVGKRGTQTRDLILGELHAQLENKTLAEVSVADVARGVQCSTAAFYQYFTNIGAAAKALTCELQAAGEPLPDGLVDQRARADALAADLDRARATIRRIWTMELRVDDERRLRYVTDLDLARALHGDDPAAGAEHVAAALPEMLGGLRDRLRADREEAGDDA